MDVLSDDGLLAWLSLHRLAHEEGFPEVIPATQDRIIDGTRLEQVARRSGRPQARQRVDAALGALGALAVTWKHNGIDDVPWLIRWDRHAKTIEVAPPLRPTESHARFAWVPSSLLAVDPRLVRLGILLLLQYSNAHAQVQTGEPVRLKVGTLWEWAGLRQGRDTPHARWTAATGVLEGRLSALHAVGVVGSWSSLSAAPEEPCDLVPPDWCTASVGGSATLPTVSLTGTPRTGPELRSWRAARGITQQQVAAIVKASQPVVSRVERGGEVPTPWRQLLRDHPAGA